MTAPLVTRIVEWYCPNCKLTMPKPYKVPRPGELSMEMHHCPKLGITAPLVVAGTAAKVTAREREDYEGGDTGRVTLNDAGRPIMSVVTERDDGQDVAVFAPVASLSIGARG